MLTDQINSPQERLSLWKDFRDSLSDSTAEEQLNSTVAFFSRTPISSRCLDYYTPNTWQTPWEILYHGKYCQSSISVLMYHTLHFFPAFRDTVELWLIDDGNDRYLVPVKDAKFVLNYALGAISTLHDIDTDIIVIDRFANIDITQFT